MNERILVVEDDPAILTGLRDLLESEGYAVETARDGVAALERFRAARPDLVLLDVMIPKMSGYDVCRAIRAEDRATPVVMLTAKGEEIDKVVGLEIGADDYVTKPFSLRELLARVAAQLRRSRFVETPAEPPLPAEFTIGKAVVNRKTYTVRLGKTTTPLTGRELDLLECFARHPDEVLSRDELLNQVWGAAYYGTTRTLDQHVAQLRKKLEPDPQNPRAILTVHGVGYRFAPGG